MALDCLLPCFLLSCLFDNTLELSLLSLSHLEPAEEPRTSLYFFLPPPSNLSSQVPFYSLVLSNYFCQLTLITLFSPFQRPVNRKKNPQQKGCFIGLKNGLCQSIKEFFMPSLLLYPLYSDKSCLRVASGLTLPYCCPHLMGEDEKRDV